MKATEGRIVKYIAMIVFFATIVYIAMKLYKDTDSNDVKISETPMSIKDIKPIGKLYLLTTEDEDYAIDNIEDPGFLRTDYLKCVQIVRRQVSWTIDMTEIVYVEDSLSDTVFVRLPIPKMEMSGHGSWFYNEGEEKEDYDDRYLIETAEKKIENKYDKPENKQKAEVRAKEIISSFIRQCNKIPVFN